MLEGLAADASAYALRSTASSVPSYTRALKVAEALAMAGEYEAIVSMFESGSHDEPIADPDYVFYAGVAYSRSGNLGRAQELWKQVLRDTPDHHLAKQNLDDSRLPEPQRNGAWAFDAGQV